jgi:hypothetical protein
MVMREGKPEFYQVRNKAVYDALIGGDTNARNFVLRVMNAHANLLRAGVTFDPGFLFYSNLIRDSIEAWVLTPGFTPIWSTLKGGGRAMGLGSGELRAEWIESVGALSGNAALDRAEIRKSAARMGEHLGQNQSGVVKAAGSAADMAIEGIRRTRDASEMANRLGIFDAELKNIAKKHPEWSRESQAIWAAYRSRDMLDFAMRGRRAAEATQSIAFARAGINAMAKMAHETARNPKLIAIRGAQLAAATAVLYSLNKDDPDYWKLSDWERNNYWHVKIPGGREWVRIPKPHGWGFFFGTAVEHTLQRLEKDDPKAFASTINAAWNAQNIGIQNIAQLGLDLAGNRQSFSGAPIAPEYLVTGKSAVRPEDQYGPTTSPTMVKIGQAIGVSPAKLEYGVKQVAGPSGDYANILTDWMLSPLTGQTNPKAKTPWRRVTTHVNPYPAMFDELRKNEEKVREDYNSVHRIEKNLENTEDPKAQEQGYKNLEADQNARAKELGYKDFADLSDRKDILASGLQDMYGIQEEYRAATTDKERYKIRDSIQAGAHEVLKSAGYNYKIPMPKMGKVK